MVHSESKSLNSSFSKREASNQDIDSLEKGEDEEYIEEPTKKWVLMLKIIFTVTGCAELFFWNSVLNLLDPLRSFIYNDYPWVSDTLNGCNNVTSLLVVIYTVKTGAMNQTVIIGSGITLGLCCLATAMTAQWAPGMTGVVLLHVINVLAGAASGFFQTGGFGLAAVMPVSMTGYVSTGQGVCGVLTWFIWYCVGTLAFPNQTRQNTKVSCWILMSLGAAVLAFACVTYVWLLRKPDVARRVAKVTKALKEEATNPNAPSYRYLFKQVWILIVTIWMCMFASLFVFPTIGPLHWNSSANWIQWTFFAFQLGDLIGRYLPNLLSYVLVPIVPLFWMNVVRLVIIPTLSILCWKLPNTAFFNSPIFQVILMLILAITNGWFISCVYINSPNAIKQEDWRSRVTSMIILGLTIGISSGLWFAKILLVTAM